MHATRLIARNRDDLAEVRRIHTELIIARGALLIPAAGLLFGLSLFVPALSSVPVLTACGLLTASSAAFSPGWLLQGLDRMRLFSVMDTAAKLLAFSGILFLVRSPEDAPMVFLAQAAGSLAVIGFTYSILWKYCALRRENASLFLDYYRKSFALFVFNLSGGLINQCNALILSFFVDPRIVGVYGGAEKLFRAIAGLVSPFASAVHAKINYHLGKNPSVARALFRKSSIILVGGSIVVAGGIFLFCSAHRPDRPRR